MNKVEGEWSGYTSAQCRVVHRMYCSDKFAEKIKALGYGIRFTDGTYLILRITKVPRRGKDVIRSYDDLIYKCINAGVNSVAELYSNPPPQECPRSVRGHNSSDAHIE